MLTPSKLRKARKRDMKATWRASMRGGLVKALAANEQYAKDGDVLENGTWRSSKRCPWGCTLDHSAVTA
jgi:hypothetical protein